MNLAEYRKQSYTTWEKLSAGWRGWREFMWEATGNLLVAESP